MLSTVNKTNLPSNWARERTAEITLNSSKASREHRLDGSLMTCEKSSPLHTTNSKSWKKKSCHGHIGLKIFS